MSSYFQAGYVNAGIAGIVFAILMLAFLIFIYILIKGRLHSIVMLCAWLCHVMACVMVLLFYRFSYVMSCLTSCHVMSHHCCVYILCLCCIFIGIREKHREKLAR